jgi:hypothetical protein
MRPKFLRLAVPLLLLAATPAARSDDETPAQRAKRVAAAFAAPSADTGFDVRLALLQGATLGGTIHLTAAPGEGAEAASWVCEESARAGENEQTSHVVMGKDLVATLGEKAVIGVSTTEAKFARSPKGYSVTVNKDDEPEATSEVDAPDGALPSSVASLILFCRMVPAAAADYEVPVFDPAPRPGEAPLQPATVHVVGAGKWGFDAPTFDAWTAVASRGGRDIEVAFDPARKTLLGLRMKLKAGEIRFVPWFDFDAPAPTAALAAARASLAMAIADRKMLEDVVDWDSALERAKKASGDDGSTVDAFRKTVLDGLQAHGERAGIEGALLLKLPEFIVEAGEGGDTKVTLPAPWKSLTLVVRPVGGVWKVVELPSGR